MESARFHVSTKMKIIPKMAALYPISANLLQHILRAHLQAMSWKASNYESPPDESRDIKNFGWEFCEETSIPVIGEGDPALPS